MKSRQTVFLHPEMRLTASAFPSKKETAFFHPKGIKRRTPLGQKGNLLLPGALLVTMQTQLLAPFVSVNFRLAAFFE
ncbi:MAG TPA: hypothetical protein VN784_03935 [Candidatus Limnocylindrales bacterium]|nr:hypothetical protein [Candidatus Limnocylindrales bacterium]